MTSNDTFKQVLKRNYTPSPCEDQTLPHASIIKRGRLAIGVVLFIRGNKIHYYSPTLQKKISVFSHWMFSQPVRLGDKIVNDFEHLKKLMKISLEDLFGKQRQQQNLTICNNSLKEKINDISDSMSRLLVEFDLQNTRINKELEILNASQSRINEEIKILNNTVNQITTNEVHTTNVLNFSNCEFNRDDGHYFDDENNPDAKNWHSADEKYDNEDCFHYPKNSSHNNSNTSDAAEASASNSSDARKAKYQDNTNVEEEKEIPLFTWKRNLKNAHLKSFTNYYQQFHTVDVIFSELKWLKEKNHLDAFKSVAAIYNAYKPFEFRPELELLQQVFEALRTSHIVRPV